jgi:hypothetical protein
MLTSNTLPSPVCITVSKEMPSDYHMNMLKAGVKLLSNKDVSEVEVKKVSEPKLHVVPIDIPIHMA